MNLIQSQNPKKDKCYVAALQGGGDKGAYQAGVIKGLVENLPQKSFAWDVVTGISVGALNGAGISIFEIGKEDEAADYLLNQWRIIKGHTDIYKNWKWFGPITGLISKTGLFDTTPERQLLHSIIKKNSLKRGFVIGATQVDTGEYTTWDELQLKKPEYVEAIMSSSALPVIFPEIEFKNHSYIDGGVRLGIDISSGINKCLDKGFELKDVVVDLLLCNSKNLSKIDADSYHTLNVLIRYLEIESHTISMQKVDEMVDAFPEVNFRYMIGPSSNLPTGPVPLGFSHEQIEEMIALGRKDAKDSIEKGEGENLKEMLEEFRKERKSLQVGKVLDKLKEVQDRKKLQFLK